MVCIRCHHFEKAMMIADAGIRRRRVILVSFSMLWCGFCHTRLWTFVDRLEWKRSARLLLPKQPSASPRLARPGSCNPPRFLPERLLRAVHGGIAARKARPDQTIVYSVFITTAALPARIPMGRLAHAAASDGRRWRRSPAHHRDWHTPCVTRVQGKRQGST